jgi:predicted Fe-Mo cluster-binding NifX family protein
MASSGVGGFVLPIGQFSASAAGGGAAPAIFRGIVPPMTPAMQPPWIDNPPSTCEEPDSSSEENTCAGNASDRDSAECLLEDQRSSANVTVQALKFNPKAPSFVLDGGSSFSFQEQHNATTPSVRARDKQLVAILTAAIMKSGCPMDVAACKSALCAPWVPDREANIARINQAGVWHKGRCTGGLLRWLTKPMTKCHPQSPPAQVFEFSVSLSEYGTKSVYEYMAQPSIGGSPVTDLDRMLVKAMRAALVTSGIPADLRACKSALYGHQHYARNRCHIEAAGGLLVWLSRFKNVFKVLVTLSGPALAAEERKQLKAEARKSKALSQLPAAPAACRPDATDTAAWLYRLSSGDVVELVHSAAHLQQLLESEAALRGDASCVVAVDCEGVPKALHLIQLAYFTMEGVKRVIIIDGVAIGEVNMIKLLAPLLTSESTVKLFHDLHMDAAAFANIGCLQLANCVDSQLVMELRYGTLLMGFNKMLQTLGHSTHSSKSAVKRQMDLVDASIFSRRPLSQKLVEYAAMDVILLLSIKDRLWELLGGEALSLIKKASNARAQLASSLSGRRRICVDVSNGHALASRELVDIFRPQSRVEGDAAMIADILFRRDCNILFLGEPRSGKTMIVLEAARLLAQMRNNVLVVDTSNAVAVHSEALQGLVRRLQAPSTADVCSLMIEGVQNHSPDVVFIDEIGRLEEVEAARACKKRGVRVIACARGDLRRVVKSAQLQGLVCSSTTISLGDNAAKADAERHDALPDPADTFAAQGTSQPVIDVIVELRRGEHNEWGVVMNSADVVGRIFDDGDYFVQKRSRDPTTGELFLEFQKK